MGTTNVKMSEGSPPVHRSAVGCVEEGAVRRMHLVAVSDGTAPASALIRVDGEIDLATEPELRAAIAHAIDDGCRDITVDLSGVSFMDCAGVNALLWCRKHVDTADGRLSLGQVSPCAARILTLTGLDHELSAPTES
jgi:anti-sigma B factor antagonist